MLSELEQLNVLSARSEHNQQLKLVSRLPKLLLLTRVIPYLNVTEINRFAEQNFFPEINNNR